MASILRYLLGIRNYELTKSNDVPVMIAGLEVQVVTRIKGYVIHPYLLWHLHYRSSGTRIKDGFECEPAARQRSNIW